MEHATAFLPKGFLQWWGAGPTGDAAVTPLCLAALTMAPLDGWAEVHVNVAPHWNRIRFSEKSQLARDGFSRCIGCLDIWRRVPSLVSSPKSSRCEQPWDCTHPDWDFYTE